jgi:tRNA pseudouridine38-40 synthase
MCGPSGRRARCGLGGVGGLQCPLLRQVEALPYDIWNAPEPNAFLASTSWHVYQPLSMPALRLACDPLIGEHDFSSFCRKPRAVPGQADPSMKRYVMLARWSEVPTDYGRACCVRDPGQRLLPSDGAGHRRHDGRRRCAATAGRRHARHSARKGSQAAGQVAPPHGLCLWEVGYD